MDKLKTLRNIADELSLSVTTISLVLNGLGEKYRVKKGTRERILNYVKAEKFVLDQRAKSLRTNRTKIVSLLITQLPIKWSFSIISYLEEITFQQGYRLVLHFMTDTAKTETVLMAMYDKQVDGCIIGVDKRETAHALKRSLSNEMPAILFEVNESGHIKEYLWDSELYGPEKRATKAQVARLFRKLKGKIEKDMST